MASPLQTPPTNDDNHQKSEDNSVNRQLLEIPIDTIEGLDGSKIQDILIFIKLVPHISPKDDSNALRVTDILSDLASKLVVNDVDNSCKLDGSAIQPSLSTTEIGTKEKSTDWTCTIPIYTIPDVTGGAYFVVASSAAPRPSINKSFFDPLTVKTKLEVKLLNYRGMETKLKSRLRWVTAAICCNDAVIRCVH